MKKIVLIVAMLCLYGILQAKPVDATTARRVAERVLGSTELVDRSSELQLPELYLFAPADSQGFVLIAADDCALPVVGYSRTSVFRAGMVPVNAWLRNCARQIADMRQRGIEGSEAVADRWRQLLEGSPRPKSTPIGPLVTTIWNQEPVFQQLCPYDVTEGVRCLAGCGAIAMAQVMKYWNYPVSGRDHHTYYTVTNHYGPLTANFDTTYAWADMPDTLTWLSSQAQQDAVNLLVYHVGVAIEMDYTPNWSNSYLYMYDYFGPSIEAALPTYFKYSTSARAVDINEYSPAEWDSLLMVELRAQRPMVYRGADYYAGGHIFVLDGCDGYGNYHINWGWGGYGDGFFALGSLNPDQYQSYTIGQCAVIGIKPMAAEETSITINAVVNNSAWGSINGTIGQDFPLMSCNGWLRAEAAEGYRFDHWSDGCINNPRCFPMTESRSDTAVFVSAGTDTVGYSLLRYRYGYGYDTPQPTYGAFSISAASLPANRSLAAAQIFVPQPGTYTIKIHSGTVMKPGPEIFTQTYNVSESEQWVTMQFDSLVSYPTNMPLWVVMRTDDLTYSVPVSRYGGVPKSFYFSSNGNTWWDSHENEGGLSAMMRAVFADPDPEGIGSVEADGTVVEINGRTVSVQAAVSGDLALYDLGGRLLTASRGNSLSFTAPAAGVYLLRVGERTSKIVLQ